MTNQEIFRKNLNHLLSTKCYSQADIAHSLGVARSTVSRWCDGSSIPNGKSLTALAECLSTTPAILVGESSTLSSISEEQLLHDFRMLSPRGKELALERMEELKQLHWYGKERIAK